MAFFTAMTGGESIMNNNTPTVRRSDHSHTPLSQSFGSGGPGHHQYEIGSLVSPPARQAGETKTDVPLPEIGITRAVALGDVQHLLRTERGTAALQALAKLLWCNGTWSLDDENKAALTRLLRYALEHPEVRELVQLVNAPRRHE